MFFLAFFSSAPAQARIVDQDFEHLLQNLKEDAKSFRRSFDSSLKKSTIRKTSQERAARRLGKQFEKQTDAALNQFKRTKGSDVAVSTLAATAQEIDKLFYGLKLDEATTSKWEKIRQELREVEGSLVLQAPSLVRPALAPSPRKLIVPRAVSLSVRNTRSALSKNAPRFLQPPAYLATQKTSAFLSLTRSRGVALGSVGAGREATHLGDIDAC